ncbi:MAG TPA: DUF2934 domain-containing protein [Vicinamibacteria bacterium]|nr:DUF2934 domain-containing protein [Vicinamibacteria bacterium]
MARRHETDTVVDRPSGSRGQPGSAAPSTSSGLPQSGAARSEPTTEEIAQRAYEIYQSRGGTEGQDLEDWLQAERELRRGSPGED